MLRPGFDITALTHDDDAGSHHLPFGRNDLRIGSDLIIAVIARTARCAIPTLEHGDLPRDVAALRVLAGHNRIKPRDDLGPQPCAGVYARVLRPGRIRLGDIVHPA
jgi:hypothetical protein